MPSLSAREEQGRRGRGGGTVCGWMEWRVGEVKEEMKDVRVWFLGGISR